MKQVFFEKNNRKFYIEDLCEDHYASNYFYLLKQLTSIDPEKITHQAFCLFINNLSKNHIVKIIRDLETLNIIGTVTVLIEDKIIHNFGKVGHIEDVVVDESMRGFGLGKKLIEIAIEECKECYKIILNCNNENKKFYEKCGFKLKGNEMVKIITHQ
jgi:glucosamine-phosphate N-acetyltransferase